MRRLHTRLGIGWLLGSCVAGSWGMAGCNGDGATVVEPGDGTDQPVDTVTSVPGDGQSDFVSHPGAGAQGNGRSALATAESDNLAGAAAGPADTASGNAAAQRAISEADIIQLSGDRLYALSRYSGLTIIDVS